MYWLSRPPYLRWAAACLLIVFALYRDLAPESTVPHPFAVDLISAGAEVTSADVVFRDVPEGLLDPVSLPFVAARAITEGSPVLVSDAEAGTRAPHGWWSVELPVPAGTKAGDEVLLVADDDDPIPGLVVAAPTADGFSEPVALIAVPGEAAPAIALAASENRVTVLLGP